MNMNQGDAIQTLAGWLLTQNSLAARLLTVRSPILSARVSELKAKSELKPPRLENIADEEKAVDAIRDHLAMELLGLGLSFINGRYTPSGIAARRDRAIKTILDLTVGLADRTLRRKFHHPTLPPDRPGPGPIIIIGEPVPASGMAGFTGPYNLMFVFDRSQASAGVRDDKDFQAVWNEPDRFILLKDYTLKLAQRVLDYLTMEHPMGPGLDISAPAGVSIQKAAPQITALDRFVNYHQDRPHDAVLIGLTRLTPISGPVGLIREFRKRIRNLVLGETWTRPRLAKVIRQEMSLESDIYDPVGAPGGLSDLGILADAMLLEAGQLPGGDHQSRLKAALAAQKTDSEKSRELLTAWDTMTRAHFILSLIGRNLPGRELVTPSDLDAALTLTPARSGASDMSLRQASRLVSQALEQYLD